MPTITPFLLFDGEAEEAAEFYTATFPDSEIVMLTHYGEAGPGPKGAVMSAMFRLNGQDFIALNGGPKVVFSPAISFFVTCESQEEVDHYWDRLLAGGTPLQCGWLTDKYGLTWQIAPSILGPMLQDANPVKSRRVMEAMMKIVKLDFGALQRAHEEA